MSLLAPLCALLFLSLQRKKWKNKVRWLSTAVDGCVVGEDVSVYTWVDCLRGQGLAQSSRCVYMPPFTAIWMRWKLLPAKKIVLVASEELLPEIHVSQTVISESKQTTESQSHYLWFLPLLSDESIEKQKGRTTVEGLDETSALISY